MKKEVIVLIIILFISLISCTPKQPSTNQFPAVEVTSETSEEIVMPSVKESVTVAVMEPIKETVISESNENSPIITTPEDLVNNSERCNQNQFKMAFILVAQNSQEITSEKVQRLTEIKDIFPQIFNTATLGLASMDTSYQITTITLDQLQDNSLETIAKHFYESNPDQFDFISIYPATPEFSDYLPTSYSSVQRFVQGIGAVAIPMNRVSSFGSWGKLLGIGYYRDYLNEMNTVSAESSAKKMLHEVGHQWCCYVGERFSTDPNTKLGIIDEERGIHFYIGLNSPYENGAYIGSWPWILNDDGTYRNNFKNAVKTDKFHPFALYFMGLYTRENYDFDKKFQLLDATYNDRAIPFKEISINDIIAVEGERTCVENVEESAMIVPTVNT